jgi:hypothetical protein
LARYFNDELAVCLFMLYATQGSKYFMRVIKEGREKVKRRHISAINDYKALNAPQ